MKRFTLYSKDAIFIFSIFLTGFGSAIMLAYNCRKIGKNKIVVPMCIISLFGISILRQLILPFHLGSILELLIPNTIWGGLLVTYAWNKYMFEVEELYDSKSVLIPFLISIVLWGGALLSFSHL